MKKTRLRYCIIWILLLFLILTAYRTHVQAGTIYERFALNYQTSLEIMRSGFIFDQRAAPQGDLLIGSFGNGAGHGCGPFAIYNMLLYLNGGASIEQTAAAVQNPATIIRDIEYIDGFNWGGVLGTNPAAIYLYLQKIGHNPVAYHGQQLDNLDKIIQNYGAVILLYQGNLFYFHYVMIRYDNGQFFVYNWRVGDQNHHAFLSINTWLYNNATGFVYTPLALVAVETEK